MKKIRTHLDYGISSIVLILHDFCGGGEPQNLFQI